MSSTKSLAKSMLRKLGFELRRVPRPSSRQTHVPASEIANCDRVLTEFTRDRPADAKVSDFKKLREYLSDVRIAFFHDIVALTREMGVELDGQKIADVGCGTGYLLHLVERISTPAELVGFDTFAEMNELARTFCPSATICDLGLQAMEDRFDVIFCTEVLEHLVDPEAALEKLFSCITSSGVLVLTVPDGRLDQQAAGELREDGTAYWGHINYWSHESWVQFLKRTTAGAAQLQTSLLRSGQNFAVVRRNTQS